MQLTVSPRQDEQILLQRKAGWSQKSGSSQARERGRIKIWAKNRTGKSPEFTKDSNLGHEKQSIDLRYFQAGPEGRKAESTLVRWHLHPQVPSALLRATQAKTEPTFCFYNFFFPPFSW